MKPGTKVICIDDSFHPSLRNDVNLPRKGRTYTIRELVTDPWGKGELKITLKGIRNPQHLVKTPKGQRLHEFNFEKYRFKAVNPKEALNWEKPTYRVAQLLELTNRN